MSTTGTGLRDPARLLDAWEAAAAASDVARGCAVLAAAGVVEADTALDLPLAAVGEYALHCHLEAFGASVDGMVGCPECGSVLELGLRLDDLLRDAIPAASGTERQVELTGRTVTARAPTVRDLLAAAEADDPRGVLLRRCVEAADRPGDAAGLSAADVETLDSVLEELAGAGLVTLRATCPDCRAEVAAVLDPGALLWDRVRTGAPALLRDVARLAAAFGWTEPDVLALSPARRRAYLELVG